jgi:pyruvate/2-oxoacid:ferredoxin oxidoreductase alpha subunit
MAVSIGASLAGARAFTASSSNGLAYMVENIMVAGFYRLPIVMAAVNRTLGPPWNIWVDQSDTLMLRDFPWVQIYCENNQEIADAVLQAFRLGEDRRILLPVLVCLDAFILSHTQMTTDLPEQELVDRYLPELDLPHRMDYENPRTLGGLVWPRATMHLRMEVDRAMERVPEVLAESRAEFREIFGRDPGGSVETFETEDAETILVATGTITTTAREVVRRRRAQGEKVGLVKLRIFRPFPTDEILQAVGSASRVGVLDRNYAAGIGGVFWHDLRSAFHGVRDDLVLQDYLTGVGGGDVTPDMVEQILDDLGSRSRAERPVWMGLEIDAAEASRRDERDEEGSAPRDVEAPSEEVTA